MNEELNAANKELRKKVAKLEQANKDMSDLLNSMGVAALFLDIGMTIRQFTPAAKHLFNLSPSDMGRPIEEIAMRFSGNELKRHAFRVMETLVPSTREVMTEEGKWYIRRILPFRTRDNRVDGVVLTFFEVANRIKAEKTPCESEGKFRNLAENAVDIIARFDNKLRYLYINPVIKEITGMSPGRFIGKTNREMGMPEVYNRFCEDVLKNTLESRQKQRFEFNLEQSGNQLYFESIIVPEQDCNGSITSLLCITRDITDRKTTEDGLLKAVEEKEVLMREIHHRVKNNMQVIVGLMRMHARRTDNAYLTKVLNECRDRIQAMSLIHEALYQSENLTRIDYEAYLQKLCSNLSRAHNFSGKPISIAVAPPNLSMTMDQGIAVGMILSEFISNAFQHAFPSEKTGHVEVRLTRLDSASFELVVSDDGVGFPPDIDLKTVPSLGLRLVGNIVAHELDGTIDVESNGGTRFIVRFKGKKTISEKKR